LEHLDLLRVDDDHLPILRLDLKHGSVGERLLQQVANFLQREANFDYFASSKSDTDHDGTGSSA